MSVGVFHSSNLFLRLMSPKVPSRPHPEPRLRDTKHQLAISDLKSVHGIGYVVFLRYNTYFSRSYGSLSGV